MLERLFHFSLHRTDWRSETVGGFTTFITLAYIVVVNPTILSEALGQDLFGELLFATCVSAAIATLIMGLAANYPFALAPGMGLNAFFAYSVVLGMGVRWDLALGVVLASGILFTLLTLAGAREAMINAVPDALKHATAAGIGLFIAFIGLQWAGVIVSNHGGRQLDTSIATLDAVTDVAGAVASRGSVSMASRVSGSAAARP